MRQQRTPADQYDEDRLEPLSVRVATAVAITGLSRSRIYELIQSGDLETSKVGRATLISYPSLKRLVQPMDAAAVERRL